MPGISISISPFLSKKGSGWYSAIVALKIAYTTTQFDFKFKAPSTSTITINWGDGTKEDVAGQDGTEVTKTSSYSGAGEYKFWLSGDVEDLTYIDINSQAFVSGDVSSWSALTSLTTLYCYSTDVSGDVSSWSALTRLTTLYCYSTDVSGDVSSWSALTRLTRLYCYSTNIEGDVSSWSALTGLTKLYCYSTNVSFNNTPAWSVDSCAIFLKDNLWSSTEVNNCLASLAGEPVTNCAINIAGTNAHRTAASDADVATIEAPVNGNTLTVNE